MTRLKILIRITFVLICGHVSVKGQDPDNLKQYTFVLLTSGEQRDQDPEHLKLIQSGHLENIANMAEEGILSFAGPFADSGDWRGLLVFNVADTIMIKNALNKDPAVKSGRLNYQLHQFYSTPGRCLE
jgi:uncharacterized protein YciI